MKFLSVCSGIEAASVAWNPLGWKAVAFSEIEPFPCAVLKHHYPDTPNWGDMTKFKEWPDVSIDLLCGGTPCQSFSVAGLRKGMDDPRGNLMLTFGAIAAKYRPKWLVWENVPGVLSSNGGRDFGSFLGMLGQLGYGFAYRVLDAQYFGVAQRRRRVFVVGCLGDWHSAAAVLFERHSLQGHPAPSRKTGQEIAGTFGARTTAGGGFGGDFETTGGLRAVETLCVATGQAGAEIGAEIGADMAPTLNCNHEAPYALYATSQYGEVAGALTARHDSSPCADRGQNIVVSALCKASFSGGAGGRPEGAAVPPVQSTTQRAGLLREALSAVQEVGRPAGRQGQSVLRGSEGRGSEESEVVPSAGMQCEVSRERLLHEACTAGEARDSRKGTTEQERSGKGWVGETPLAVRRLTVEECEFLQGCPRGYTAIPWRKKPANECPDGPRYRALGNSWAIPVVRWIGERIDEVDRIQRNTDKAAA